MSNAPEAVILPIPRIVQGIHRVLAENEPALMEDMPRLTDERLRLITSEVVLEVGLPHRSKREYAEATRLVVTQLGFIINATEV